MLTIQPKLYNILHKFINILDDNKVYENLKTLAQKKTSLEIKKIDENLNNQKGGQTIFFTEQECSFF
jgi:hypothetical protein